MKNCNKTILLVTFLSLMSVLLADSYRVPKSILPKHRMDRIEPEIKIQSASRESCPAVYPMNVDNYTWFTLIDSSANGYGMVSSVTRPIDINSDNNWLLVYRQFTGPDAEHGQIGAAYSINGQDFQVQYL